ncbi:MAG TPA: hypothetical protein VMZ26_15010 [Pyrinomonadaceae bacterium]|nr:hypothetical protein [Pyrinomonadaceae bacterium]
MKILSPLTALLAVVMISASVFSISAQELTPEQLIARHRDSIGTKEALAAVKNQMVVADVRCVFSGSAAVLKGKGLILSEGDKSLWGMSFNSNDYPQEKFGFDGKEVRVAKPTPSAGRSPLGDFLFTYTPLLKGGVFGGTLSYSWALLTDRKAKMSVDGRKTIDGKGTIGMSYAPKGGSDVTVKMYFDEKTFQHVRTEYSLVISATQGSSIDASAGQTSTIIKVVETFSNFGKAGDLTLPRVYKITYTRTGSAGTTIDPRPNREAEWVFAVTNVNFNQELEAGMYKVDG